MGLDQSKRNTQNEAVTLWTAAAKYQKEDDLAKEAMDRLQNIDARKASNDDFVKWSVDRRRKQTSAKESDHDFMEKEENMGKEMWRLIVISWPLILNQLSLQFLPIIDAMFSGQLVYPECLEDANVCALNVTFVANVWFALVFVNLNCISSGVTTLCAMCFGANQYFLLSIYVQIAIVFVTILSIPIIILTMSAGTILGSAGLLAGSTQEIRDVQQGMLTEYVSILAIGILPKAIYMIMRKYIETQGIMHVATYISLLTIPLNLGLNTFFVTVMGWRANGVALATASSQVIQLGGFMFYSFVIKKYHKRTWKGWHPSEWKWVRWQALFRETLPRMLSESAEGIYVQAIFFMSAVFGTRCQAVQGILVQVFVLISAPTTGVGNAVCIKVGQMLGMGRAEKAKTIAIGGSYIGIMAGCCIALIICSSGVTIGYIFSPNDPVMWDLLLYMRGIFSLALFLLSTVTVNSFIMFAQGRASVVAKWFLICTWLIGGPLAAAFAFARRGEMSFTLSDPPFDYELVQQQKWQVEGLHGLWQGLVWGYGAFQVVICWKMINSEWKKFVRRAAARAEQKKDDTADANQKLVENDKESNGNVKVMFFDRDDEKTLSEREAEMQLQAQGTVAEGFRDTGLGQAQETEGYIKISTEPEPVNDEPAAGGSPVVLFTKRAPTSPAGGTADLLGLGDTDAPSDI